MDDKGYERMSDEELEATIRLHQTITKTLQEIQEERKKDYLQQSLNQNPLYSDPYR